jgi:membrane-associated phospholipid phosphatase
MADIDKKRFPVWREMWKNNFYRNLLIFIFTAWAFVAILLVFIDLQISIPFIELKNQGEEVLWGEIMADYGEYPGYLMILVSVVLLSGTVNREGHKKYLVIYLVSIVGLFLFLEELISQLLDHGNLKGMAFYYYLFPFIFLGLGFIFYYFVINKFDPEKFQPYANLAKITLIMGIFYALITIQVIKLIWGRVRPRDLLPSYTNFTPWYLINGYNGNQSFPSGHTAMGWMLLPLICLAKERKNKIVKWGIIAFAIFWGFFAAASRIVVAAHYASDTLFATGIACIFFIYFYYRFHNYSSPSKQIVTSSISEN